MPRGCPQQPAPNRLSGRTVAGLSSLGFGAFAVMTVLVHARALVGLDLAFTGAKQAVENPLLEVVGAITGVLVSAEVSVLIGLLMSLLLWRAGLGLWSATPLAFVLPVFLELGLKMVVYQPPVPAEFHSELPYPLLWVPTPGAYPSGHALRTGFFCAFLAVLAYTRGSARAALRAVALLALAVFVAYSRVYVGDHWLSDVVGGLLLGGSTALLAAWPVGKRLAARARKGG